jgi:hypothetical protein
MYYVFQNFTTSRLRLKLTYCGIMMNQNQLFCRRLTNANAL